MPANDAEVDEDGGEGNVIYGALTLRKTVGGGGLRNNAKEYFRWRYLGCRDYDSFIDR